MDDIEDLDAYPRVGLGAGVVEADVRGMMV